MDCSIPRGGFYYLFSHTIIDILTKPEFKCSYFKKQYCENKKCVLLYHVFVGDDETMNMNSYLDKVLRIEDLVVLSYYNICTEFSSARVNKYCPKNCINIQECISTYFEKAQYNPIGAIKELKNKFVELNKIKEFDFDDFYCIIKTIDMNYNYVFHKTTMDFTDFQSYSSLSKFFDDPTLFLLPKFKKSYIDVFNNSLINYENKEGNSATGLRKKLPYDKNNINAYLENLILLRKQDIANNKIVIHELRKEKLISTHANQINFALIPVSNKNINDLFVREDDGTFFWINNIKPNIEEDLKKMYLSIIRKALAVDIDFIIFPEAFFNNNLVNHIQNFLRQNYQGKKKQILILGSIWDNNCNKTVVMASDGVILYEQHKKIPSNIRNLEERLLELGDTINVIDIPEVTRLNTFICRDITDDKLMCIPKVLGSSLIIAPCYSYSLNMKDTVKVLASKYHCSTIIANSCSARFESYQSGKTKDIGFICQPLKDNTENDSKIYKYKFNDCCTDCNFNCNGFLITFLFDKVDSENNKKTFQTIIQNNMFDSL